MMRNDDENTTAWVHPMAGITQAAPRDGAAALVGGDGMNVACN
jgi:hypothetical protein